MLAGDLTGECVVSHHELLPAGTPQPGDSHQVALLLELDRADGGHRLLRPADGEDQPGGSAPPAGT